MDPIEELERWHCTGQSVGRKDLADLMERTRSNRELSELCAIDLEWNCRKDPLLFRNGSRIDEYRQLAKERSRDLDISSLVVAEWIARNIWGDAPYVDDFIQSHQGRSVQRANLIDMLADTVGWHVTACSVDKHLFCCPLRGSVNIGRRDADEPASPNYLATKRKLIICESSETVISRTQFIVELVANRTARATNMGRTRAWTVGGTLLSPNQSMMIGLPLTISVGSVDFTFATG